MTKQSVNQAFILLDKTLKYKKQLAKDIQTKEDKDWYGSIGNETSYNPDDRNHGTSSKVNDLIWRTDEPDHNGTYTVFLFKTTEKYPDNRLEAEAEILKTSELRKTLLKNNIAEVGITIENTLQRPNDTVWGWTFRGYEYYIIKDGKTTYSNKRSDIRKIYNNHEFKPERQLIRIDTSTKQITVEVENLYEYEYNKVYYIELEDGNEYFLGTDDSMRKYFEEVVMEDDWRETLIQMYGGKDKIIESFFEGGHFQPDHLLMFDEGKNFCYFLGIDRDWLNTEEYRIENCNFNGHIEGMKMYKKDL